MVYFDAGGFACDRDERDQAVLGNPGGNDHGKGEPLVMVEIRSHHTHSKQVPYICFKRDKERHVSCCATVQSLTPPPTAHCSCDICMSRASIRHGSGIY